MKTHWLKLNRGRGNTSYCGRYVGRYYNPLTGRPGVKTAAIGESPTCEACRQAAGIRPVKPRKIAGT